jgi:hypothetical protein
MFCQGLALGTSVLCDVDSWRIGPEISFRVPSGAIHSFPVAAGRRTNPECHRNRVSTSTAQSASEGRTPLNVYYHSFRI